MTRLRPSAVCAALLAVLVSFATAAQDAPFPGVITEKTVEVRSGAGRAYYVVGELKQGDIVSVQKVLFNQTWYQVRVPKNIHSYVSKAFVDAQGDGETGKINADRTEFKAASLRGPGESYRVQGTLSKGDTVTIIGEEGNFYKIASPADAFVFIPAGTLRKATPKDLEAAGGDDKTDPDDKGTTEDPEKTTDPVDPVPPVDPKDPGDTTTDPGDTTTDPGDTTTDPKDPGDTTTDPKDPGDTTTDPGDTTTDPGDTTTDPKDPGDTVTDPPPTLPDTDTGWPAAPQVEVSTPARSDALKALELKVLPYFELPVTEQPLDKMAGAYQQLAANNKLPGVDQQIIKVRLRQIEGKQKAADAIKRAEKTAASSVARTVVPDEEEVEAVPTQYTAVGRLEPSTVYDGRSLPLLYRIVDATPSGRTLAYVAPNDDVNIAGMLNQLVGIVGKTRYNRALKLNIIEIDKAVLLEQADEPAEDAEESAEEAEEAAE